MIAQNRDMRQLPYRQRKYLSTAKNSITGQEHDWPGKLCVTLRSEVPGLQGCKGILTRANLRLPVEGDLLAVAKAIDDRDRKTIVSTGVVTDIDDHAFQGFEIASNLAKSGSQSPPAHAFQLKDPKVAKFPRSAVVKHPRLGLRGLPEPMAEKSLLGCFEELLDLSLCEFPKESGLFLRAIVTCLPGPASSGLQLDMPVMQRRKHLAEDIKELIIACLICDIGSIGVVLLFPVNVPQVEKWVSVVEGLPQDFEIPFRVANHHGALNLRMAPQRSLIEFLISKPDGDTQQERSGQGARLGSSFTMSSKQTSSIA